MSINHEIEKAVQTDRPSGTPLRPEKEVEVFFSSSVLFHFLGTIPSWVLSQTCWMICGVVIISVTQALKRSRKSQAVLKCFGTVINARQKCE
jgi:hypothetical protein